MVSDFSFGFGNGEMLMGVVGVGAGMNPAQYLKPGDVMEVSISGIGTLRNGVKFA